MVYSATQPLQYYFPKRKKEKKESCFSSGSTQKSEGADHLYTLVFFVGLEFIFAVLFYSFG